MSVFYFLLSLLSSILFLTSFSTPSPLLICSVSASAPLSLYDEIVLVTIRSAAQSALDAEFFDKNHLVFGQLDRSVAVESNSGSPSSPSRMSESGVDSSRESTMDFQGPPSFFMGGVHITAIRTDEACEAKIFFFLRQPPPVPPALPGQFEPHQRDSFVYTAAASTGQSITLNSTEFDQSGGVLILKGLKSGVLTIAVQVRDTETGVVGAQVGWPVTITGNCPVTGTGAASAIGITDSVITKVENSGGSESGSDEDGMSNNNSATGTLTPNVFSSIPDSVPSSTGESILNPLQSDPSLTSISSSLESSSPSLPLSSTSTSGPSSNSSSISGTNGAPKNQRNAAVGEAQVMSLLVWCAIVGLSLLITELVR